MTTYDAAGLAARLRREMRGVVSQRAGDRVLFATDASNYRVVPDLVITPADVEDLALAVTTCADVGAPVTLRGGGTSLAGNAIGTVVVDTSRHLTAILDVDPAASTATVEPGVVLTSLLARAARHRLTFGADPSSASRATLGGMIANNACGAHSLAWGTTSDNLLGIEALLADGSRLHLVSPAGGRSDAMPAPGPTEARRRMLSDDLRALGETNRDIIAARFGRFSRQVSGYALQHVLTPGGPDLARLLCGSEGTLAVTLRATVRLTARPPVTVLLLLGFTDSLASARAVTAALPYRPLTVESLNAALLERLPASVRRQAVAAGLPTGQAWLLIEMGGEDVPACRRAASELRAAVADSGHVQTAALLTDSAQQAVIWRCRRDAAGLATRRADGSEAWGGWEDAAVPPDRLADYLEELDGLLAGHGLSGSAYGHFGEGCLHMRVNFDFDSDGGRRRYRSFVERAAELVIAYGGSVSGEHGDGRARSELLTRVYGARSVELFREVKRAFDPRGALNPGVVVDPLPLDGSLRVAHRSAASLDAAPASFAYPDDNGSLSLATRRCVGVGKCRQESGGVMCPSYRATKEERHSTRGRAHLLWEMLDGSVVTGGWRSEEVREALDLCLSCKGCLSDCPVNVDMATYKAEFLAHHYSGRPWARPRSHYSMGWLPLWLRAAARAPGLTNALTASPAGVLGRRLGGVSARRQVPRVTGTTLSRRFAQARSQDSPPIPPSPHGDRAVLLWPDTFTNYFAPDIGAAAVAVLEDAGFTVRLPSSPVCCGLTLVTTGQLRAARRVLRHSLDVLAPVVAAGVPIIGLEPSCTAMLQHDAPALLPQEPRARAVANSTYTLAAGLSVLAPEWQPPHVGGAAILQAHCHQHAVSGLAADQAILERAGVVADLLDAGCCGMAGSFGFEAEHYQLSMRIGELAVLPAVREAPPGTAVIADGFSCRTQIKDGTGRQAKHLAELLAAALPTAPS
jgi:FAD/FMN-containing dehydrogenase/Fe-S oxidoreductase